MKTQTIVFKSLFGLLALLLVAGVWVSPAAADTPANERDFNGMEYLLRHAQLRVEVLQSHIDFATDAADLIDAYIQEEQAAGHDTSDLEAALTRFRSEIEEAQTFHTEAARILDEKAGFDENGQVVDPQQARLTLTQAHQAIQDGNRTLIIAKRDMRQAMRTYHQSLRLD